MISIRRSIPRKVPALLALALLALPAFAANDNFQVRTIIDPDTTAPSIPQNLTAIPVATSQIDLDWDASTDNVGVSGYHVYRDDVQVATTSGTAYSDTGLTAATLYGYYVTAFDAAGNVSASSSVVATTTLAAADPPAPDPSSGGERIELQPLPLEITRLSITEGETSARMAWETRGYVRSVVRWGVTSSYELGSIAERTFARSHETVIEGLSPGTMYYYAIEGENGVGVNGVLAEGTFTTRSAPDTAPPANVTGLTARREGSDVLLSWENPDDPDLSHVRLLRNDRFYPNDTADGLLVFEGDDERVRDEGAAVPGTTQYYTAFAYDAHGNISSGAVVAISIPRAPAGDDDAAIVTPPPDDADDLELELEDFIFEQDGRRLPVEGGVVSIDGTKRLTVKAPYERFPEHLKTILITLQHPGDPDMVFSFILRTDEARTWYTATLAPLSEAGEFQLSARVFDFKTAQIGTARGALVSTIVSIGPQEEPRPGIMSFLLRTVTSTTFYVVLVLFLLLIIAFRLIRTARE